MCFYTACKLLLGEPFIVNHLCKETHLYKINVKDNDRTFGLQFRHFMYIYYQFHYPYHTHHGSLLNVLLWDQFSLEGVTFDFAPWVFFSLYLWVFFSLYLLFWEAPKSRVFPSPPVPTFHSFFVKHTLISPLPVEM